MTPEERIAQIAAQRGGSPVVARRPVLRETRPVVPGADTILPAAWKRIADNWQTCQARNAARRREDRLAAGVIARCLGPGWRRVVTGEDRIHIVHRDGYGFGFARVWNNLDRFRAYPLERWRTDEGPPAEITVSAARPLGEIAADIARRLIDAGLQDAYEKATASRRSTRVKRKERCEALKRVARAFGGYVRAGRRWRSENYPEAWLPGGEAVIGYGFDDSGRVHVSFDILPETAEAVGSAVTRERRTNTD